MKKILGNHDRVIPYRPQLKMFFGSTNAAVLYAQLEYWFGKNGGDSFYKFNAPCDNERYKKGDSLTEELGFSHDEVESALKRICRSFKSKKDFDACEDKFDSMPMCSYYDRITYTKFYFRNNEVCDYINSKDMDDLPVFADGRSQSLESGSSVLLENGISVFGKGDITCSILYLYKRLQQKITLESENFGSIAHSDTDACTNNKHQYEANDCVTLPLQAPNSGDVRKKKALASASYACIGKNEEVELKNQFEAFRVEYRKSNGSVMGLDKEFENLKKRHPKTWHVVVPTLIEKLKDQNNQRKAQLEETKFTPELPMLSRYIKEQMWDRHYYTSQKTTETKKTIPNFTPDQLTPLNG